MISRSGVVTHASAQWRINAPTRSKRTSLSDNEIVAYRPARRYHYNPCFWTALWNERFFREYCTDTTRRTKARTQQIYTLNLRSNKILQTTVENVHYDKIGMSEITPESMLRFTARYFPEQHQEMARYVETHPENLYLDFEATLTGMERLQGYDAVMRAAKLGGLASTEHKGFLACAIVMQAMRSHELTASMLQEPMSAVIDAWEWFWLIKNAWSNRLVLGRAVLPLALGEWTLWRTEAHCFPLPDSPVMIDKDNILAILSPRLLLRIDLRTTQREDQWNVIDGITSADLGQFRRCALRSTFKDIVAPDGQVLSQWQSTVECQDRVRSLATAATRAACIHEAATRVLWAVNGFGRVGEDFETWAPRVFDSQEEHTRTERIRGAW
jgi:hypothetical protein